MTHTAPNTSKIALVTGANRGIGFEIARQLAQKGVTVLLAARRLTDAEHAAAKIATDVMQVIPVKLDVTQSADIAATVNFVAARFGVLDILVNNAGVWLEGDGYDIDILRRTLEANTIAPAALTLAFLPLLKNSVAGRIVNQSSDRGSFVLTRQFDEQAMAYSTSKAALNMLTMIQAEQLKDTSIKVNAAHPGWVRTSMGGEDSPLSPQEGAKTALRLALLPDDGPTGKFFHLDQELPW